jgi:hypothetical protein
MIIGSFSVSRVKEESICRITEDYELSEIGDYKIHSTTLMPNIEFAKSAEFDKSIDSSIFINEKNKLKFDSNVKCQNFLTTRYIGRAPLEFYGPKTKMGREFVLICRDGDPSYRFRVFGTEGAIHGYNRSAHENFILPKD